MCCIVNLKMQKFISNQMFLLKIFFTVNEVVFQVVSQFEVYLKWMSLIESIFFWWYTSQSWQFDVQYTSNMSHAPHVDTDTCECTQC
jgi:hypothetical protein